MPCRIYQFLLLRQRDAGASAAKSCTCAHPYFNKYQCYSVAHDEVDLAKTAAVISLKQNQIPAHKKQFRATLSLATVQVTLP